MKILVVGSGGREHALIWKLKQSPRVSALYCAPGNAGIAELATCVPIKISDHNALVRFAKEEGIDMTVIGPDDALAAGIVDRFESEGLRIFGPRQSAARLESSKVFAKEFMEKYGIPTAKSGTFSDSAEAQRFVQKMSKPVVIKADGLALGKGVIIAQNTWQAALAIHAIMDERRFGLAGQQVVIEEFLEGVECSIHALVDGENYLLFPPAQDHKRALDGDAGPNTGGMGTYSPAICLSSDLEAQVRSQVMDRFIAGLKAEGIDYRGMLFPGLMLTKDGIKVLEFNCRFGDPETQVLLARLDSDLLGLLEATIDRQLGEVTAEWKSDAAVCVILASGGYPGLYTTGKPISGLENMPPGVVVFHAGTRMEDGQLETAGGRVLGVTALGSGISDARDRAYAAVEKVEFEGRHFRTDIAVKGLKP